MDLLRNIEANMGYRGMGEKTGKCWIINECHGLRGAILSRFLTLIEQLPEHCCVMFTTTNQGQASLFEDFDDAGPFVDRCRCVPMAWHQLAPTNPGPLTKAFALRAAKVAQDAGLDGHQPLAAFEQLALSCKHSLRRMLSKIEDGVMLQS